MGKRGCVMASEPVLRKQADEGFGRLNTTNCPPVKAVRVGLSDITNIHQPPLPAKALAVSSELQDAIQSVHKENSMLHKLLEERNKIIEVSNLELEKLRTSTQKLYAQNCQLAKANTLMMKELNLAKDKLKEQQHEYGCSLGLLKAKNYELEDKLKKQSYTGNIGAGATKNDKVSVKREEVPASAYEMHPSRKVSNLNRRRQSKNSLVNFAASVDHSTGNQEVSGVEPSGNKRRSSKLTTEQTAMSEDEDRLSVMENSSFFALGKEKFNGEDIVTLEDDREEAHSSVGMPSRKSVENVVLSEKKSVETSERILRSDKRSVEVKQPNQLERKITEVDNSQCFTSETSSCAPNTDVKDQKELGRRRSFRAATLKVVSYKEKKVTMKERRPD